MLQVEGVRIRINSHGCNSTEVISVATKTAIFVTRLFAQLPLTTATLEGRVNPTDLALSKQSELMVLDAIVSPMAVV